MFVFQTWRTDWRNSWAPQSPSPRTTTWRRLCWWRATRTAWGRPCDTWWRRRATRRNTLWSRAWGNTCWSSRPESCSCISNPHQPRRKCAHPPCDNVHWTPAISSETCPSYLRLSAFVAGGARRSNCCWMCQVYVSLNLRELWTRYTTD